MFKAIKEFFTGKPAQEPVATPRVEEAPYKIETPVVVETVPAVAAPVGKKSAAPRAKKPAAKNPTAPRRPRTRTV